MNSLMPLQVVVPVKSLSALVALERSIILLLLLVLVSHIMTIYVLFAYLVRMLQAHAPNMRFLNVRAREVRDWYLHDRKAASTILAGTVALWPSH